MSKFKRVLSDDDIEELYLRSDMYGGEIYFSTLVEEIEQAVLAKVADIRELSKDAERYRWLRDMIKNQDLTIAKVGSWSLESWSGDDPDHYIDADMGRKE